MSITKAKGEALYLKMKAERERLVKKYTAGGTVSYDEATGLRGPAGATTATVNGVTYTLTKTVSFFQPDAVTGAAPAETNISVPDFDQIKLYNQARGVASGSMMDALAKFGSGKIVQISGTSAALNFGGFLIGEVPCLVQVTSAIRSVHGTLIPARPTDPGVVWAGGGADRTRDATETAVMLYRGKFKIRNYRATPEMLTHPTSIWATADKSRQSMFLLGVNSLIRMYGEAQVLDLNGFRISHHERPNRFAAFSALVDLADGHFLGLSSKGAKNAHIYCSKKTGILGRNNHFAIRGHLVDGLLVEDVVSGDVSTINEGSYFGTVILNQSSNIVLKAVQQKMVNKAVSLSSAGLSFYAQLVNQELLFGYFETVATWNSDIAPGVKKSSAYPWLKWEDKAPTDADTFGNGKKTPYPVLKTQAELEAALGANSAKAPSILAALEAAQLAYSKSMKSADDMYIQVHTASSRNHPAFDNSATATGINIPHTTNGVVVNPSNPVNGLRYPDSVGYGFRVGAAAEGVGRLADTEYVDQPGLPRAERSVKNIHIMDSSFKDMQMSMMEAVSLAILGKGLTKTFNGMALRPFGYSNTQSHAVDIASSLLLMSKAAMEAASPAYRLESKSVDSFDTAALAAAAANASLPAESQWTAEQAHGLYKGNDIAEASLACIEAIGLLRKYFPQAAQLLSGIDNSAVDVGILALRKSMLAALDAKTAAHIGLKGGYNGDIFQAKADTIGSGSVEIYPWLVSATANIDKDSEWSVQQVGNAATPAQIKTNRKLSMGYRASSLPARSSSIMRLKMISADEMALVRCDASDTPVTYQECADLLDFSATSIGAPASMSAPVVYKIARNLDGQNHVHKGIFGVRVDEAEEVSISNVLVQKYETEKSRPAVKALGSVATQVALNINSESEPQSDVQKVTAVSINACETVAISDISVKDCIAGSEVFGVEIAGRSEKVSVASVSGSALTGPERATVLRVAGNTKQVEAEAISGSALSAAHSGLAPVVQIESASAKLK